VRAIRRHQMPDVTWQFDRRFVCSSYQSGYLFTLNDARARKYAAANARFGVQAPVYHERPQVGREFRQVRQFVAAFCRTARIMSLHYCRVQK
jgi:hypothetical protein